MYLESRHIQDILDISKDQLLHWVKTMRLVKPIVTGKGRGGRSKFSFKNLLEIAIVKEMLNFGLDLNSIVKIKKEIDRYRKNNKNVYSLVLEDDYLVDRFFYIYKSGEGIVFYPNEPTQEIDLGEMPPHIGTVPDMNKWKNENKDSAPPSFFSGLIFIGMIAVYLINELEKKNIDWLKI